MANPVVLGDIEDLAAFVGAVVRRLYPAMAEHEIEEYVAQGMLVAWTHARDCPSGEKVSTGLAELLEWRLRDYWRAQHREWSRDAEAYVASVVPLDADYEIVSTEDTAAVAESRTALSMIRGEADLRDPRVVGRLLSVPSWRALPTGQAAELWPFIDEERRFSL